MKTKIGPSFILLMFLIGISFVIVKCSKNPTPQVVGIVQFVHHPLLDETEKGIIYQLTKDGLNDGKNFVVKTVVADKDIQIAGQIVDQFLNEKAKAIIAIATPAAQVAAAKTKDTPIIFAAITDPLGAKLVNSLEFPGRNLSGTSNRWPFEKQLELIPKIFPRIKKIGAIWNPSEVNSQSALKVIRPLVNSMGLELVEASVSSTTDVAVAVKSLANKVDIFFMIPDNTVLAASTVFIQTALTEGKFIIGGDLDTVNKGSIATYGYDYFQLGCSTAKMVKEILIDKKQVSKLPVRYPEKTSLSLNHEIATKYKINFPSELINIEKEK